MHGFGGIFFHVQARDADLFCGAFEFDFKRAGGCQRKLIHRNLIALGKVRIKIILSCETRMFLNTAMQGQRGAGGQLERASIEHGERSGKSEAYRTDICVWGVAEARRAATEDFGLGAQLRVHFEADDGLVAREKFGSDARSFVCSFHHGPNEDYNISREQSGVRQQRANRVDAIVSPHPYSKIQGRDTRGERALFTVEGVFQTDANVAV